MAKTKDKDGILLPPAVGYSLKILWRLVRENHIPLRYYPRLLAITLINLVNLPFRAWERAFINPGFRDILFEKDPVFIIGHWRSGTTHLHNILCQDPQMAYVTTYQSVFPDTLMNKTGRFVFENFMKLLMPKTRAGDNVILSPVLPQEEEFALGDKTPVCYYYFWIFPKNIFQYYDRFVRLENINPEMLADWKNDYRLLLKKAIRNSGGQRILSKNPTNTGRVKFLLELFPNAKFIHIHRNPVEVFLSTRHFYEEMMPRLQLQEMDKTELERAVIGIYKQIMQDYLEQKDLIPSGNLAEISFDALQDAPEATIRTIYNDLNLGEFDKVKQHFIHYFAKTKSYTKNKHHISRIKLETVTREWDFVMKKYNYQLPDNIIIHDE